MIREKLHDNQGENGETSYREVAWNFLTKDEVK